MPDARVQSAIDHWAPRFVQGGVDYNDFVRTTARIERWEDWLDGWRALGDQHAEPAREAEASSRRITAGDAWLRAAVAYHFGRFVWVLDADRARAVADLAVEALYAAHRSLDPTAERIEAPLEGGTVVGNLRRPALVERPPLVLIIPGLDSAKEEFFTLEEVFLRRGMATLSMEGPGQGECGYDLPIRPDYEVGAARRCSTCSTGARTSTSTASARWASRSAATTRRGRRRSSRASAPWPASAGRSTSARCGTELPELTRETFAAKSGAADDDDARRRALELDLDGVLEQLDRPALFVTGRHDRLIPRGVDRAHGAGRAAGQLRRARGRQPRVRERAVSLPPAGRRLAARPPRMRSVAVIGAGMWAPRLAAAAGRAGLDVVTCFSRTPEKAERLGVPVAASFEAAIADVEGVILATPNDVHAEQAVACAARGKHVFVEKPIADTLEGAAADPRRVRAGRRGAGRRPRLPPPRRRAARRRAGARGPARRRSSSPRRRSRSPASSGRRRGARTASRNPGGPLMQLGIHHADTLAAWLGPVRRTTGRAGARPHERRHRRRRRRDDGVRLGRARRAHRLLRLPAHVQRAAAGDGGRARLPRRPRRRVARRRARRRGLDDHRRRRGDRVRAARHARRGAARAGRRPRAARRWWRPARSRASPRCA